jgi:nucleoid-associated protein YgaU
VSVISWGTAPPSGSDFPFTGVVTNLSQRFSLFRADGRPVRAILTVVFTEWLDPTKDLKDTDPEITTRLIKRGDTLSSISAEMYSDPTRWRVIAQANQLDDPRQIQVGLRLTIPKIR